MITDGKNIRQCLIALEDSAIARDDREDLENVKALQKFVDDQENAILKFFQQR